MWIIRETNNFWLHRQRDKVPKVDGKKLTAAVDIYVSDFGTLQIVPARHIRARDVFVLDPNYASVAYLQQAKQEPLAKNGLSERRLILQSMAYRSHLKKHTALSQTSTNKAGASAPLSTGI